MAEYVIAMIVMLLRPLVAAGAVQVHGEGDDVLVELTNDDLAELNQYLASRGVFVSYLAPRNVSLEDVFMELTSDTPVHAKVTA